MNTKLSKWSKVYKMTEILETTIYSKVSPE
jgi:hypothetical protein